MLSGAHVIIYSEDPEADRAFFRYVLELPKVDVGDGWLIFALPPSEVAIHPAMYGTETAHELYLMCDDINEFVAEMKKKNVTCSDIQDHGWGLLTALTMPGGSEIGVYEPKHERPASK